MTLLLACIAWVFASALVAMLPMRRQYIPGVALLLTAPVLIILIGVQLSPWAALAATLAFASMYRNPLRFFWAKLRGQNPQLPK